MRNEDRWDSLLNIFNLLKIVKGTKQFKELKLDIKKYWGFVLNITMSSEQYHLN